MHLFRPQALNAKQSQFLGSAQLARSAMAWPMTLAAIVFVSAAIAFAALVSLPRQVSVVGRLVPATGLAVLSAPANAVVQSVLIKEGDLVQQNQPLITLSIERESAGEAGIALGGVMRRELARQRKRLTQDQSELAASELQRRARLAQKLIVLERRVLVLSAQQQLKKHQFESSHSVWQKVSQLKGGSLSALQLQQYEGAALAAEAELNQAALALIDAQSVLANTRSNSAAPSLQLSERSSELARAIASIDQALARNETERSLLLRAPRAGQIANLAINPGQTVILGLRLLELVPVDAPMIAELWVPERAAGTLAIGTKVAMRYQAFPFRQFGAQTGFVSKITNSATSAPEILENTGLALANSAFRVEVVLDRQQVLLGDKTYALRVGMSVDADLLLESAPIYQSLFALAPRKERGLTCARLAAVEPKFGAPGALL